MQVTNLANNKEYEIRLIEFIAPTGWTITSFYQLIKIPDVCIGCTNSYDEAFLWYQNPRSLDKKFIEKSYEFFLGEKILISADLSPKT